MRPARFLRTLAGASALTLSVGLVASTGDRVGRQPARAEDVVRHGGQPGRRDRRRPGRRRVDPEHRLGEVDHPRLLQRDRRRSPTRPARATSPRCARSSSSCSASLPADHRGQRGRRLRRRRHAAVELRLRGPRHQLQLRPRDQHTWVPGHLFPAVPGMPQLLRTLADRGYEIYGITGRPASQEADTIANLNEQGFTADGTPAARRCSTPPTSTPRTRSPRPPGDDPNPALGRLHRRRRRRPSARRSSTRR